MQKWSFFENAKPFKNITLFFFKDIMTNVSQGLWNMLLLSVNMTVQKLHLKYIEPVMTFTFSRFFLADHHLRLVKWDDGLCLKLKAELTWLYKVFSCFVCFQINEILWKLMCCLVHLLSALFMVCCIEAREKSPVLFRPDDKWPKLLWNKLYLGFKT